MLLSNATGDTVIELRSVGAPAQWAVEPATSEPRMNCSTKTQHLHCVVQTIVGAHSSQAQLYLVQDGHFVTPAPVTTDTPDIVVRDLDGDGDLDLDLLVDDYQPDYADGGVFWQTAMLHDKSYTITGCTPVRHGSADPPPTILAYGGCPR